MKNPDSDSPLKKERSFDWQEIRQRLEKNSQAVARGFRPGPEEERRILRERARLLAGKPGEVEGISEVIEVVEFRIAQEHYGLESRYIREVYPLKDLTPLPCIPAFVLGIINFRGEIISVVDLKKFFDLPDKGLTDLSKVIILHNEEMEFAILADAILATRTIPLQAIQSSLPTLTEIRAEYLTGVTDERLVVLNGQKLLADSRLVVREEVAMPTGTISK